MAFGVKIKIGVDTSQASALQKEIQELVNSATKGNAIKIKDVSVDAKAGEKILKSIQSAVNKGTIEVKKIKFSGGEKEVQRLKNSIQKSLNATQLDIKIKNIDASNAVNKLRTQLTKMLSGLSITGVGDFVGAEGIDGMFSGAAANAEKLAAAQAKINSELAAQKAAHQEVLQLQSQLNALYKAADKLGDESYMSSFVREYRSLSTTIQGIEKLKGDARTKELNDTNELLAVLRKEVTERTQIAEATKKSASASKEATAEQKASMQELKILQSQLDSSFKSISVDNVGKYRQQYQELSAAIVNAQKLEGAAQQEAVASISQRVNALRTAISAEQERQQAATASAAAEEKANAAAVNGASRAATLKSQITAFMRTNTIYARQNADGFNLMFNTLNKGANISEKELADVTTKLREMRAEASTSGMLGKTPLENLQAGWSKFGGWSIVTKSMMSMVSGIRESINAVRDLDAALTELRKVTDLTESQYDQFMDRASVTAREIGASVADTVNATADFARLGYSVEDAEQLASAALVYKNVGDGISDISESTESLISTMKAFDIEAENSMSIVDAFNKVGNEFAISSSGIGEALQRSAAALAAGGNTLEESIGLVVGMNNVIQDPQKVGTTLKTVSMYLRAAKTDLEAAGESTEGMANSVSELRQELMSITGYTSAPLDIMLDDTTFKSTYQVMEELAAIWDQLADVDQANILELIGGKRNSNAVVSLLTNWEDAAAAMEAAMESAGSATEENAKFLDSIQGKVNEFRAAFETMVSKLIDSDLVKFIVDIGTRVMDTISWLIDHCGALSVAIAGVITTLRLMGKIDNPLKGAYNGVKSFTELFKRAGSDIIAPFTKIPNFIKSITVNKDALRQFQAELANGVTTQTAFMRTMVGQNNVTIAAAESFAMAGSQAHLFGVKAAGATIKTKMLSAAMAVMAGVVQTIKTIGITLLIGAAINGITSLINKQKELNEARKERALEDAQDAIETSNQVDELMAKYDELSSSYLETGQISEEFANTVYDLIDVLGLEGETIDDLIRKYGNLDDAIRTVDIEARSQRIATILGALNDEVDDVVSEAGGEHGNRAYSQEFYNNAGTIIHTNYVRFKQEQEALGKSVKEINDQYYQMLMETLADSDAVGVNGVSALEAEEIADNLSIIKFMYDSGFMSEGDFEASLISVVDMNGSIRREDPELKRAIDERDFWTIIEKRNELREILSAIAAEGYNTDTVFYQQLYSDFTMLNSAVADFEKEFLEPAVEDHITNARSRLESTDEKPWEEPPENLDEYYSYIDAIVADIQKNGGDWKRIFLTEENLRAAVESYMAGTELGMEFLGIDNEDILGRYVAQVESIEDLSKRMEEAQDILTTAQSEMLSGGLSADTVSAISGMLDEGESISDYLTIENGAIELNIQKWRERIQAMSESPSEEFDKEIAGLNDQNKDLQTEIDNIEYSYRYAHGDGAIEYRGQAAARIAENEALIEQNNKRIAQLEEEKALYDELFDSSTFAYDAMFAGLDSIEGEAGSIVSALNTLTDGAAITRSEWLGLAQEYPELIGMDGFLSAETVDAQRAILDELLSTYENKRQEMIRQEIKTLQDERNAIFRGSVSFGSEAEKQQRIAEIDSMTAFLQEYADVEMIKSEEVDTWDQLTEAVSNTTEAYELLADVKAQVADGGMPDIETLSALRELLGDDVFSQMISVGEDGRAILDVDALEAYVISENDAAAAMRELNAEYDMLAKNADANADAMNRNRLIYALLASALDQVGESTFADTLEEGIAYVDDVVNVIEQAREEVADAANDGVISADTILDLSQLYGLDLQGLLDAGYLSETENGYVLVEDAILGAVEAKLLELGVEEDLIPIIMQGVSVIEEEAGAYEQLISVMEQVSSNADLLSDVNLDMADDGRLSMETLVDLLQWLNENGISDEGIINWENGYATANIEGLDSAMRNMIDTWVDAETISGAQADIMREEMDAALELSASYDQLSESISDVSSRTDLLSQARTDKSSGRGLSDDTITSIIGSLGEGELLSDYIIEENGVLALNERAWIQKSIAQRQAAIAELQNKQSAEASTAEQQEATLQIRLHTLAIRDLVDAYNDLGVDAAYDKFNAAQDAMSSYGGGAEITYDNIRELIDVDSRYAAAIDRENGVLVLNAEKHAEITEAILEETKATAEAAKQAIITGDEYQTLWEKYDAGTPLSLDEAKRLRDLEAQIAGYDALTASIDDTNDAYHRWINRPDEGNTRSNAMAEAYEHLQEVLTDTESESYMDVGTETFQRAWDLVIGMDVDVNSDEFDGAMEAAEKYVVNEVESAQNFYDALVANGIVDSETGQMLVHDINEAAALMGMSSEMYSAAVDNYNEHSFKDQQITIETPEIEDNQEELTELDLLIEDLSSVEKTIADLNEEPLDITLAEGTETALDTLATSATAAGEAFGRIGTAADSVRGMIDAITNDPLSINTSQLEDSVREIERLIEEIHIAIENVNSDEIEVSTGGSVSSLTTLTISAGVVKNALTLVSTELSTIAGRVDVANSKTLSIGTGGTPSALGSVSSQLSSIISKLNQIRNMGPINVSINQTTTQTTVRRTIGSSMSLAGGNANAAGVAAASGKKTLVGELGREIVVDPYNNRWYTVGDNGAEFVQLPKDAIVFSHEQTERLLNIGSTGSRGKATGDSFASGNAAAFSSILSNVASATKDAMNTATNAVKNAINSIFGDKQYGNVSRPGGSSSSGNKGSSSSGKGSSGGGGSSSSSSSSKSKYEDLLKKYQELNEQTEHLIEHQEFLYYQSERGLDYDGMADSLTEQARLYGEIMKDSQAAVDEMKAKGATDTDEELQEMERAYWDAYKSMYEKLDELNKLYVEALNDKIDDVQSAYDRFKGAAEEFNKYGGVSMDTFQELLDGGLEYLSYLENVNGQYIINEDAINDVIAAEKEQLSIESALSYLGQIREALGNDEANRLDHLVDASEKIGDSTWDLVYAQLEELKALGLSGDQYTQILNNIEAMQAISDQVVTDIAGGEEELEEVRENQKSSLEDIIGLVQDLIEYETDQQIEAIEEQIDAYQEIIDLKKEALKASRDESDYEKDVAEQLKEIAELQSRIGQLSLDDSREGQAERAKLEEELAEAQEKLADLQGDNAYDKQVDALDELGEAFEEDKQAEIDALEEKISSEEKLYQLAIERIENGWSTLYEELIAWNTEAGSILNAEITQKWKEATEAAQEYGSYLEALRALGADPGYIAPEGANGDPVIVATDNDTPAFEAPVLENDTVTITGEDGSQATYRFVDSMTDEQLSQLVGNVVDARVAQSGMATGEIPVAQVQDNSAFTFAPTIQVSISHNGTMSDEDVKKYGTEMANATLEQLRVALERKGVSTTTGAALKQ